ncbi:hypothetical protein [Alicycliphilus denitrificans]|uniref:Uncharacterized protein n=1 Tax=Alicycliphilus denitrificans TaxID=179636 RepID=A0A3R7IG29_9BURK|nr:hypothetical protein [Alicycliphilus denitrificans]RKJ96632.1 hypothetical protein CE154_011455 [Alicycliphilus denitrificans]
MATLPSFNAMQQVYGQQQEPSGFAGLLSSPVGQGLLSAGLGALASRGTTAQAIGRGGLLGLSAYGQAQGHRENRLMQMAQAKLQQDALAGLKPGADGSISASPAQLVTAGFSDPAKWADIRNLGRDKIKQMQTVTGQDGSQQIYGVDEYGGVKSTGLTNAPELKTQDLGGQVVGMNPYTGTKAWSADKTATPAEVEASRHNRASEGIAGGNLALSRERLAFDKQQPRGQIVTDADGGVQIVNTHTGEARPVVGPDGQPVIGKGGMSAAQLQNAQGKMQTVGILRKQIENLKAARAKLGMADYGIVTGRQSVTDTARAYDAALAAIQPTVRQLTRTPGEGAMSDYETRLQQGQLPGRVDPLHVIDQKITQLDDLSNMIEQGYAGMLKRSPKGQQAAPQGGASGGWSIQRVD